MCGHWKLQLSCGHSYQFQYNGNRNTEMEKGQHQAVCYRVIDGTGKLYLEKWRVGQRDAVSLCGLRIPSEFLLVLSI